MSEEQEYGHSSSWRKLKDLAANVLSYGKRQKKLPEEPVQQEGVTSETSAPIPNFYIIREIGNLVLPSPDQLVASSKEELERHFGREFEVPNPPAELFETLRAFTERGITEFDEAYYLPRVQLNEDDGFWKKQDGPPNLRHKGRWTKPEIHFWQSIKNGTYPIEATMLEGAWYIGDKRGKPWHNKYKPGEERYSDDYMEPLMAHLRETERIERYRGVGINSRAGATPLEIERVILPLFAEVSGAKGVVRYLRYMEFNIRGNMAHLEWGQTNTTEYFSDQLNGGNDRLAGGESWDLVVDNTGAFRQDIGPVPPYGGLSHVGTVRSTARNARTGFSPVVVFPSTR